MNNKVFGILGVSCINSNWNADFTGNPKTSGDNFVASPFSFKYAVKKQWDGSYPVLGLKSYITEAPITKKKGKETKEVFGVRDLKERFIYVTGCNPAESSKPEVIKALLNCIDVANFGVAFAVEKNNISLQGPVQINTGINKYDGATVERVDVLSPYRNSSKLESEQTTIGSRSYLTEAHFFYNFTVNPNNYKDLADVGIAQYERKHYEAFKSASLCAVSNLNSVSKCGCDNEFAMFVELKEESFAICNNINHLVSFIKGEDGDKNTIDLNRVFDELKSLNDDIKSIEVYYNPRTTVLDLSKDDLTAPVIFFDINRPKKQLEVE